jgi:hypothetical protein
MDQTVPITIESKGTATPSDKTNEWDYTFFLNVEPDVTWISLFRKHFSVEEQKEKSAEQTRHEFDELEL